MSFNLNVVSNFSSYEARAHITKTKLAPLVDRLAAEKRIFGANEETQIPRVVVESPLLRNLAQDYKVNKVSGLAVLRTKGGMGKTVAARILLRCASRGIMFHGAELQNPIYWRNVAQSLGLPADMYIYDTTWIKVLVETVARGYDDTEELTFIGKMIRGCSTDTTVPEPDERQLNLPNSIGFNNVDARAVIVFDDFNQMTQEDLTFFENVYRVARGIPEIYCFVTTQDATIANSLLAKNAWLKLSPLPGCYISNVNPLIDDIPQDTGRYPDPTWHVAWSTEELQQLVVSRYDERMLDLVKIQADMGPTAALVLCYNAEPQWRDPLRDR